MIDPLTAIAVGQGLLGLGKAIFGGSQAAQAKKRLNSMQRPQMQIPQEAVTALNNAEKNSLLTTLPGSDLMKQGIDRNTMSNVNALGEVSTGGSLLEGTNRAYQNSNNALTDLDVAGAKFNAANQQDYRNELDQMSNLKNQQFQVNELDPYNQRRAELNNQRDAGNQNLWGGINSAASAAGSYLGMKQEQDNFDRFFPQGTAPQTPTTPTMLTPQSSMSLMQRPQIGSVNPLAGSLGKFDWTSMNNQIGKYRPAGWYTQNKGV
jgi:hypothetical protein